jgi:hypothetical protein
MAAPSAAKNMLTTEIWLGETDELVNIELSARAQPLARAAIGLRLWSLPMPWMVSDRSLAQARSGITNFFTL